MGLVEPDWGESLIYHDDDFDWKLWFAWYPVKADDIEGEYSKWKWLTAVWWCKLNNGENYYVMTDGKGPPDDDFGTPLLTNKLASVTL